MRRPRRPRIVRKRTLDNEEEALWQRVADTVTPLKPGRTATAKPAPANKANATKAAAPKKSTNSSGEKKPAAAPYQPPAQASLPAKSPLNPVDRKLTRRIGRGARPVDAAVDLHGLTQRQAHHRLLTFLLRAQADGHKLVLVVTGKGYVEPSAHWWEDGNRGVLRRAVPQWLSTEPFRDLVVGYEQAHRHKGGAGAIYVQIRRKSRSGKGKPNGAGGGR